MFYVSNLAFGLESGLDRPELLLKAIRPFRGEAGIEFFMHYHDAAYKMKMENVSAWLHGLPRTLHGPFLSVEATSPRGTRGRAYMLEAYRWAFQTAQALNCGEMVFHTHQRIVLPEEKAAARQACIESLTELTALGAEYGVTLLLENLGIQKTGVSLFDEKEFCDLVALFPKAGCLIDLGHLHVAGWNMRQVLRTLSSRIRGYHLHDNNGIEDSHRPIGEGTINYTEFWEAYRQYTPKAHLTLEYADGTDITSGLLSRDLERIMKAARGL